MENPVDQQHCEHEIQSEIAKKVDDYATKDDVRVGVIVELAPNDLLVALC